MPRGRKKKIVEEDVKIVNDVKKDIIENNNNNIELTETIKTDENVNEKVELKEETPIVTDNNNSHNTNPTSFGFVWNGQEFD